MTENIKNRNKEIVLTFDYELSLGNDSGTLQNCIIKPTDYILNLFDKYNAKGIFFIDATYLLVLKKNNKSKELKIIEDQIKRILKSGSNIELHIHPHWLDSYRISDDRWSFKNYDRYRLHSLNEKEAEVLFKECFVFLQSIINKYDKKYKIYAFRAGGWSIQPFEKIKNSFVSTNLIFDFSVNPGLLSKKESYSYYDFRNAPKNKSYWRFDNDPCIPFERGAFIEVPVTTVRFKNISLWINHYFYRKNEKEAGDGRSVSLKKGRNNIFNKITKLFKIFFSKYSAAGLDGLNFKYFKKLNNKLNNKKLKFITYICHPKKLSISGKKSLEYLLKNYKTIGISDLIERTKKGSGK